MQIKVILESNKQQFDIKLDIDYNNDTIGDVKTKIKNRINDINKTKIVDITNNKLKNSLIFAGKYLNDDTKTVNEITVLKLLKEPVFVYKLVE